MQLFQFAQHCKLMPILFQRVLLYALSLHLLRTAILAVWRPALSSTFLDFMSAWTICRR